MKPLMSDLVQEVVKNKTAICCTSVELANALDITHTDMTRNMRGILTDHLDLLVTSREKMNEDNKTRFLIYDLPPMAVLLLSSRIRKDIGVNLYKTLLHVANPSITPNEGMFEVTIRDKTRIAARKEQHLGFIGTGKEVYASSERMRKVILNAIQECEASKKGERLADS